MYVPSRVPHCDQGSVTIFGLRGRLLSIHDWSRQPVYGEVFPNGPAVGRQRRCFLLRGLLPFPTQQQGWGIWHITRDVIFGQRRRRQRGNSSVSLLGVSTRMNRWIGSSPACQTFRCTFSVVHRTIINDGVVRHRTQREHCVGSTAAWTRRSFESSSSALAHAIVWLLLFWVRRPKRKSRAICRVYVGPVLKAGPQSIVM
jgi:hypothetical protein